MNISQEMFDKRKEKAKENIDRYSAEIRDYRDRYGNKYSEYLVYRLQMEEYYRGVWNTLNELERGE